MERRKAEFPVGVSTVLMQSEETMNSYMGLTREQKREMLTHALIGGPEQNALLRGEVPMGRKSQDGAELRE